MTASLQSDVAELMPPHYACIGKYELDLVSACSAGCIYCGLKNEGRPRPLDIGPLLAGNYPTDLIQRGIYLSPNSDPFSKHAKENAHRILEAFLPKGVNFLVTTKNVIPSKTLELMKQYPKQIYAQVSLARLDDRLNKILEPGAATASERLLNIQSLVNAGLMVTTLLMPLYPGLDDTPDNLARLVRRCAEIGNKYMKASYLVINPRDDKARMMENSDLLKDSWNRMTEELKINIGGGRILPEPQRMQTYALLEKLCRENGIVFYSCPILDPRVLTHDDAPKICKTYQRYSAHTGPVSACRA